MERQLLPQGWDDRLARLDGHFLQSSHWAQFQSAIGNEVTSDEGSDWSFAGSVRRVHGLNYLFVQCGPTIGSAKNRTQAFQKMRAAAKARGLDFVRFEPMGVVDAEVLYKYGAREVEPVEPKHPWVLGLRPDVDELRSGLSSGHRYGVNSAERKGLSFRRGRIDEVDEFLKMMHDTTKGRFTAHGDEYYQKMIDTLVPDTSASLFFAELEGKPVASALVFDWNKTRYYAHAGAYQGVNRKVSASMPLVWHMIVDAKQHGFTRFDFWGVTPSDDPNHPWAGFSTFKKAFGGEMLTTAGTWELPIRQNRYRLYRLVKKVRRG